MLSERGELIGQFVMLALFVIWVIAGVSAQKVSAQVAQSAPQQQVQVIPTPSLPCVSPLLWPGAAPVIAAIIAGIAAWLVAHFYTKRLKRVEVTLEFSRRFHELIQQQCVLNRKRAEDRRSCNSLPEIDKQDADAWWWSFFEQLQYEFYFWQRRLIRDERFIEWMVWSWHNAHPKPGEEFVTCGVDYKQGWKRWHNQPAHDSGLIKLLDAIHRIPDEKDEEMVNKKVQAIVKRHRLPFWQRWGVV
ncbi:MAG: hypothetical protein WB764_04335 [Xanthobacteraceae bacterium]